MGVKSVVLSVPNQPVIQTVKVVVCFFWFSGYMGYCTQLIFNKCLVISFKCSTKMKWLN